MVASGSLSAEDAGVLANGLSDGLSSLQDIDALPTDVQVAVKNAFQQGSRWSFISLIPWAGVAVIATLFLSNIRDTDKLEAERLQAAREDKEKHAEAEKAQTVTQVL